MEGAWGLITLLVSGFPWVSEPSIFSRTTLAHVAPNAPNKRGGLGSGYRALGAKRGLAPVPGAPHGLDNQAALCGPALKRHSLEPG